jgi:predicted DNA-binding transcriptional regulator AlpA
MTIFRSEDLKMLDFSDYVHKKDVCEKLAVFLQTSFKHVETRVVTRPDFPSPHVIGAQKFWKAKEVERWVEAQKVCKK